jgi:hypothetical protein
VLHDEAGATARLPDRPAQQLYRFAQGPAQIVQHDNPPLVLSGARRRASREVIGQGPRRSLGNVMGMRIAPSFLIRALLGWHGWLTD